MRRTALGVAAAALLAAPAFAAADVKDESFRDALGARVLRESVVVRATPAQAWDAFTTDAGFMKWAVPWGHITPGNGGLVEFRFGKTGTAGDPTNIRHRIALWLPAQELILQNEYVPAGGGFDPPTFASVRIVLTFHAEGAGATRVTETVVGFGDGAKYDELYKHLHDGNIAYLQSLAANFEPKT